ncbi:E3 ubiquitin-protein ligase RNF183 [Brachionichthys hirsutus]|uniref:E3 ubiquitin-protein ligase RNF183 n=1 Tax=Brachionichthys hirsutus TaxID=412623 RepID=UPI003604ED52
MSDDRERHRPEGSHGHGHGHGHGHSHSHQDRPPANVKPQLDTAQSNSKADRGKKPARVRRARSIDSGRAERGRRRETERHREGERRKRGRSEEARRRDRRERESEQQNVRPPENEVEDTECAVCFCSYDNIFRTPKLLACGHTFCLECLARINVTSPELKTLTCPVCREVTNLPHGKDLPRLGNNQDIIGKLPAGMQRVLSIRFQRSKGKLLLKNPQLNVPIQPTFIALPKKNQENQATAETPVVAMEEGTPPATVVNVGRPPNRVTGQIRRLFRSDRCYYAVVGTIIAVAVVLILVGILAFVIVPRVGFNQGPRPPGNQTSGGSRP